MLLFITPEIFCLQLLCDSNDFLVKGSTDYLIVSVLAS